MNQSTTVKFITAKQLSRTRKAEILTLWNEEYPQKLNYNSVQEFDAYLGKLKDQSHIMIVDESDSIIGWYIDFMREDERWFAIIVDSRVQGQGLGKKLIQKAKEKEPELNGWVIDHDNEKKRNGAFYKSPLAFYQKHGFKEVSGANSKLGTLSVIKIKWERKLASL